MFENNKTQINDFDDLRLQRIPVPDDFAAKIMNRIDREEAGGLSSMSSKMRIMVISLLLIIYSSTGILIGVQSWKSVSEKSSHNNSEIFIKEFIQTHHLNSVREFDVLLSPSK